MRLLCILIYAACALLAGPVSAQTWPDKPLRIIVAFVPGGLIDTLARALQPRLAQSLGQPVIIENRGGAGGTVAESVLAKSAPDGYTVMVSADSPPANPHLFRNLNYDFFRDIAPISMVARVPFSLVVHPSVPGSTLADLIAYIRDQKGRFSYASPGTGTGNHLFMELLKGLAGIDMTHVPYKGGGPAMNDLIGGQVQASLISITLAAPQARTGRVRAVAVTSEKRAPLMPQVPTFVESGYAGFTPHTWFGLFVPTGTPASIIERLHAEFGRAARASEVQSRFQELGAETIMNTPAEFVAFLRAESDRLGALIRDQRIAAD